ncbi:MAG: class I SAM-dependent methyltransferase [Candidatus Omnitrophica bacterium]|nr:class I SAM-dependent methyltransferase [Candidatus Omnitrophota bacterium]
MEVTNKEIRLRRFYGDVARVQNRAILGFMTGVRVLDVGCGYGCLVDQIKREKTGIEVIGIDVDPESIKIAKSMYGIDVRPVSVCNMNFPDGYFDTVILREAVHHLYHEADFARAMSEIGRVCKKELIIFDPNPNWVVKLCRKIIRHSDPEADPTSIMNAIEKNGFKVTSCIWRDVVAFPASGGFVGREIVPNNSFIKKYILLIDEWLNLICRKLRIQRYICWRYIIYATKKHHI